VGAEFDDASLMENCDAVGIANVETRCEMKIVVRPCMISRGGSGFVSV